MNENEHSRGVPKTPDNLGLVPGVDLQGLRLENIDFSGMTFAAITIRESVFANCSFEAAYMEGCNFDGCVFDRANFDEAVIAVSSFTGARIIRTSMRSASVVHSGFDQVEFVELERGSFDRGFDATDPEFSEKFRLRLVQKDPPSALDAQGVRMLAVSFNGAVLIDADFREGHLLDVTFDDAVLLGSTFEDAALIDSILTRAMLVPPDFGHTWRDYHPNIASGGHWDAVIGWNDFLSAEEVSNLGHTSVDFTRLKFNDLELDGEGEVWGTFWPLGFEPGPSNAQRSDLEMLIGGRPSRASSKGHRTELEENRYRDEQLTREGMVLRTLLSQRGERERPGPEEFNRIVGDHWRCQVGDDSMGLAEDSMLFDEILATTQSDKLST